MARSAAGPDQAARRARAAEQAARRALRERSDAEDATIWALRRIIDEPTRDQARTFLNELEIIRFGLTRKS